MLPDDHYRTPSNPRTPGWNDYQDSRRALVKAGRFREAFEMDAARIRDLFKDGRYENALRQADEYLRDLEQNHPELLRPYDP